MKHVSPASECIKCICIVNVHLKGTVYKCTLDLTHGQHKSYANWFKEVCGHSLIYIEFLKIVTEHSDTQERVF